MTRRAVVAIRPTAGKVKGATIHWVDAVTAVDAEVRLYDDLFLDADPDGADKTFWTVSIRLL